MTKLIPCLLMGALCLPGTVSAQYKRSTVTPPSPFASSDRTIHYEPQRNEPANSGIFGIVVNPAYLDVHGLNLNIGGGAEFFYTWRSLLRISGGYYFAYADNIGGENHKGEPNEDWVSYGTAVNVKPSSSIHLLLSPTISSWEKTDDYHITLGKADRNSIAVSRVSGTVLKAITGRLGYVVDKRMIETKNGIAFETNTPAFNYNYQGEVYPLRPENLDKGNTMMQSNIAVIGVALTTFRDMKITLDDDRYTGRRQEKSQTDVFFDLLYAHQLQFQDMIYYHSLEYPTQKQAKGHLPQRLDLSATPVNKLGARVGYQFIGMYKRNFGAKCLIELGLRPGPSNAEGNLYLQITYGIVFGAKP